ncbi:hypothetical protein CERSUDRAFT_160706 [Gelatoporia subvermispora B]|uniref:Arrestin C-terminal-like domain-containing protein n=1 Tax=Ceriporiopsis subvermispora (strain B) TaxID=914234 RepID=M2R2M2_CERS8|nr:hypothetical protein CERSUDRAFT_160706 [Gelatoporia subvermispora B]
MPNSKHPHKNSLEIRLTEPVVFLRAGDATGRPRHMQPDAPPGLVRGLLTLRLVKPTRISSIEIELVGKASTAWPEGVGARRIEITEEHEVYSQSYVYFRAGSTPASTARRTLSVGPGVALDHDPDEEDHSDHSSEHHEEQRGRGRAPLSARRERRHVSVDQTNYQRNFVAHRENHQAPSPPYSPGFSPDSTPQYPLSPGASFSHRMRTLEESPERSLEDLNRAFSRSVGPDSTEHSSLSDYRDRSQSRPRLADSSHSSFRAHHDHAFTLSARPSLDEEPEFLLGSSTGSTLYGAERPREPSRSSDRAEQGPSTTASSEDLRGRRHKRFSLASVSNALLGAVKDRVRSRSPMIERRGDVTPPRGREREASVASARGRTLEKDKASHHKELSALSRVGEALGWEVEESKEYGDGWKEFRKGVYTYPISFSIPANSPPSLQCEYGSVIWRLKAYAHRPGTFTTKLSALQEITVVACPSEDDMEETESIIVERQWDTQMQYLITIAGRSFVVGGTLPISITFMPWTKMKIYRISVILEEKVEYLTLFKRVARSDPVAKVPLLSLKTANKDGPPILPLSADDPDAFRKSPFVEVLGPDQDAGEYASSLMGPGPWVIRKELQLPKANGPLRFTNKNKKSNISVSHVLKIVFRVERGDDSAIDPQTGRRKLFDIVVQTPVHLLSYLCQPEFTALPPYSGALTDIAVTLPSPQPPLAAPQPNGDIHAQPPSHSPAPPRRLDRFHSGLPEFDSPDHSPGTMTPVHAGSDSIFDRTMQFERLIAGQETESGEAPPPYAEVAHA